MSRRTERQTSQAFDLAAFLPYRISHLAAALARGAVRFFARHGLAVRDWRVLVMLGTRGPLTAAEIVERTGVDKAGVSRSVAVLERRGLVAGRADPADERRVILAVTAAGQALVQTLLPHRRAREAALLDALTADERAALDRILAKLQRRADELLAAAERDSSA